MSSKPYHLIEGGTITQSHRHVKDLTSDGNTPQEGKGAFDDSSEGWRHEIRKRSPVTPWFPLRYATCATVGKVLVAKAIPKVWGLLGTALIPVQKKLFTVVCPVVSTLLP